MYVYHLSHIDLDGYGCQYLTNQIFNNIKYYNSHYGIEIISRLKEIEEEILIQKEKTPNEKYYILITDLNLTTKEANIFQSLADRLTIEIQLLDHHISGEDTSKMFEWYNLDSTKSATLITYEWLLKNFYSESLKENEKLVYTINSVDIWKYKEPLFEFGKVSLRMISDTKEINRILFPEDSQRFKLFLIHKAKEYLDKDKSYIDFDDDLYQIKKQFFIKDKNNTKDNLSASYISNLLSINRNKLTINYFEYRGILGYNLGNISILGNLFLVKNQDYDFYMDVNFRGGFSLRSNNKVDVAKMAEIVGKGGGHKNASGGKIEKFKDSFIYENMRIFVQNYINEKILNLKNGEK